MISPMPTQPDGNCGADRHLSPPRPSADGNCGREPEDKGEKYPDMCRVALRHREFDAAIADEDTRQRPPGLARRWRALAQKGPPEQQLQRERDVAEGLDIDQRQLGDQPVARQPGDAYHGAENRRQHDPENGDVERVDQTDKKGAGISVGRRVGDQRLADRKRCLATQKTEPGGDVLAPEVDQRVVDEKPAERDDDRDEQHLIKRCRGPPSRARTAAVSAAGRRRAAGSPLAASKRRRAAAQRIGMP